MTLFTLSETDLVQHSKRTSIVRHINLACVTDISHIHYNPDPNDPHPRDAWHVSLGDPSVTYEITQMAFERIKQAMS